MADKVLEYIVNEILRAKYISISVDPTPGISLTDQHTVLLRYVTMSDGEARGCFLTFIPIESQLGEKIAITVLNTCNSDMRNLRSQLHNSLHEHNRRINQNEQYNPCAAYSLNLIGVLAVESAVHLFLRIN